VDSSFLLCFNAHHEWQEFVLPGSEYGEKWAGAFDTSPPAMEQPSPLPPEGRLWVPDRCLIVLERVG